MSFDGLMVDGASYGADKAIAYFDSLIAGRPDVNDWAVKLRDSAAELIANKGLRATTSGTTGPPKPFLIPHRDLLASCELTRTAFGIGAGARVLHCLPCDYVAGKLQLARGFALGWNMHFIDPRGVVLEKLHTRERFRFAAMVPLQLHRMLDHDSDRVNEQFGTILLGGGPVSDSLRERIADLRTTVVIGYGSTETVTHVALRPLNGAGASDHFTAIGPVHFGRDPRGCLVVYTPHLNTTQHVTNDAVELVDETRFRWLGRVDHVILTGGKKLFPEQLEARTAGAIPYPHFFSATADELLGQRVVLTVETERTHGEVVPGIMDALIKVLHPHEMPRSIVLLPRLDRTSSGKIKR